MPSGVRGTTGDWKKNGQKKNKCTLKKTMNYRPIKFYYEVDEATSMKLKSLIGKTTFNPRDFQRIITAIISKTYDTQKGKVFK